MKKVVSCLILYKSVDCRSIKFIYLLAELLNKISTNFSYLGVYAFDFCALELLMAIPIHSYLD